MLITLVISEEEEIMDRTTIAQTTHITQPSFNFTFSFRLLTCLVKEPQGIRHEKKEMIHWCICAVVQLYSAPIYESFFHV